MNKEKSTMEIWAENEIKIACERENPNRNKGEWDYGCDIQEIDKDEYERRRQLANTLLKEKKNA